MVSRLPIWLIVALVCVVGFNSTRTMSIGCACTQANCCSSNTPSERGGAPTDSCCGASTPHDSETPDERDDDSGGCSCPLCHSMATGPVVVLLSGTVEVVVSVARIDPWIQRLRAQVSGCDLFHPPSC